MRKPHDEKDEYIYILNVSSQVCNIDEENTQKNHVVKEPMKERQIKNIMFDL